MRRPLSIVLALLTLAGVLTSGAVTASARSAPKPTLQLLHTHRYGDILVDGAGFVVYGFSTDKPRKDSCQAVRECLAVWPAVAAPHTLRLGHGVKRSLVGSIRLSHGTRQLTYNGWPLYTYVSDTRHGETSNIGIFQFGGFWPAVTAAGKLVPAH